ncbi:hypothetical protein DUI87_09877 [Hirundo rustica rustica]|uniref:Molybdenum cofactor sulfurase middle domain-containing protein n=1 Tax=Hirundo rustica rustica TaxID=333673 RepID=A0A3M0KGP0_HIRRU|nr:hypothetical protein DUI87_09877 [Hirundo rustica rustica]
MSGPWGAAGPARQGWLWGAAALLALGALLGAWRWAGPRRRRRLQRVGTVLRLFVYPVKSCRGVSVRRAQVTPMGLRSGDLRDRFWLVVREDGHMVTARQEPRLVLVSADCENGHLILEAGDMERISVPVNLPKKNPIRNCRVFGQDIQGRDCGDEVAQWITTFLNSEPCRLVHFEPSMVPRKSKDTIALFRNTDEDTWEDILIGDVEMKGTVCCGSYRLCDPSEKHIYKTSPLFGKYFAVDKTGTIQVGDPVYKIVWE